MTDTASRPSVDDAVDALHPNQAGARINRSAFDEAEDFLPLDGIDHVEFWVGNARQASAYFRALWGFTPVAFSGLETRVRDRASYVMQPARHPDRADGAAHPRRRDRRARARATATASATSRSPSHDVALGLARDDAPRRAFRDGARPSSDGGEDGVLRRSAVQTYGEVRHSFIDRSDYHGIFAPGYRKVKRAGAGGRRASACSRSTTASATSSSAT